jgi:hypothetical protein
MLPQDLQIIASWGADVLETGPGRDADEAIDLLTTVALREDSPVKSWLAGRLGLVNFGKATADRESLFSALGFRPSDEDLKRFAGEAARQISLEVQKGAPGSAPDTSLSYSLQSGFTSDLETVAVFIPGGARAFDSIARYTKYLDRESVERLLAAALTQIGNPENALANRIFLLEDVGELVPRLVESDAEAVVTALDRLISEAITESPFVGATTNPLSPFQADLGSPADLHARAIYLMAKIGARFPDRYAIRTAQAISSGKAVAQKGPPLHERLHQ